jgi:hypothetical protein
MQSQHLSLKTRIFTTKLNETRVFYESLFNMVTVDEWNDPDDKGVILSFDKVRTRPYWKYFTMTSSDIIRA